MQHDLPLTDALSPAVRQAIDTLAGEGEAGERGSVFTKDSVVDAILDLCGYTEREALASKRLLEPASGDGRFLLAALRRLLCSYRSAGGSLNDAHLELADSIRAVELHLSSYEQTRRQVAEELTAHGLATWQAETLCDRWLRQGDFLLGPLAEFDVIVGNPPYVRQERIPNALLEVYRRRFETLYDRADLYVLFYERCLKHLKRGGVLGFICANRWIKNKYGGPLRRMVAEGFHLRAYIDMERADAFDDQVDAYPAITIIERASARPTIVALGSRDDADSLSDIVSDIVTGERDNGAIVRLSGVTNGRDPWLLDAPAVLPIVRSLERRLPTIEEAEAQIRIGVATGCDRVYIGAYDALPVEPARKLKLAVGKDLQGGRLVWGGKGVVNPWTTDGRLASLDEHPLFAAYVRAHRKALAARHTARKAPDKWYRTIDRIHPQLAGREKLLIPDIKGDSTVVYDPGGLYPHHNLYCVTSEVWSLRALQALLRSSVTLMFIAAYGVRMAGGFLRFQAQYLRRVRVPALGSLSDLEISRLEAVAEVQDQRRVDEAAFAAYGLSDQEQAAVSVFAQDARAS